MQIDTNEKRFTSDEVAAAAGCREGTLRQWRSRHGLLGGTVEGGMEVKKFSLVDVCVVRAVQVMTAAGSSTSDAVAATIADDEMRAQITILLSEKEPFSTLFGFRLLDRNKSARDKSSHVAVYMFQPEDLAEKMAQADGVLTVLDVMAVIKHVHKALKLPASRKSK